MSRLDKIIKGESFPRPINKKIPDFAFSQANITGNLYNPTIDQMWIDQKCEKPKWPDNKPYAVCITHDVDVISLQSKKENFRRMKHIFKTRSQQKTKQNLIIAFESLVNITNSMFSSEDPYHRIEDWLKVEQEVGARSTFFFAPEHVLKSHFTDCWYKYDDKLRFEGEKITVAELMRELNRRGWEIGLHPSWHSSNSVDEMKYQKEQIEKVLDCEIVSVRQHCLHFDNRITPSIQEAAGFKYDSTLGFNDNIGFRRGTSYAYPLYNIENNKILPVWELPLIIQDGAMFNHRKGMRLDKVKALEYIQMIAEKVKEVGGILTLLWHPHLIVDEISWNTFQEGLKMLQKDDPWFASVREIGDWWNNNVKIDLVSFIENLEK